MQVVAYALLFLALLGVVGVLMWGSERWYAGRPNGVGPNGAVPDDDVSNLGWERDERGSPER